MPRTITELTLATTNNEFNNLWKQVYSNRVDKGTTVVDKRALMHLLYDHSQLVGFLMEDFSWLNVRLKEGDREAQEESFIALNQYRDVMIENNIDIKSNNEFLTNLHPDNSPPDPPYEPFDNVTESEAIVEENDRKDNSQEA